MISVDLSGASSFFDSGGPDYNAAAKAHRHLAERFEAKDSFAGWLELPRRIIDGELTRMLSVAERIKANAGALVVVGVGGSYLGARAAVDFLRSPDYNALDKDTPDVYFVGNNLSAAAISGTLELLGDRDFYVNVISKSGSTLEPAIAFRIFRQLAEKKYGDRAKKRIIATTDESEGILHDMAVREGWERFVVPGDVGGRYSVLSAVGLLPMAVCGVDIRRVLDGADRQLQALNLRSPENPAWQYAAARRSLYSRGKYIELLACYEPRFRYMTEWWKQLFGESEGKNGVGIFPAGVDYTADLHSMGQFIQDGPRNMFETVVRFKCGGKSVKVPFAMGNPDGLNYLAGKELSAVCEQAGEAVRQAHIAGGVPNITVTASDTGEESFAELVCFFEIACAISGYMLGVNPFDQPGVEAYKSNMRELLGRL